LEKQDPKWTTVEASDGWIKLELGDQENEIELLLSDYETKHCGLVNRKVLVSHKPKVDDSTKFHLFTYLDDRIRFKTKRKELFVKFLKDERFFTVLDQDSSESKVLSTSELKGAEPTQIFKGYDKNFFVAADNNKRLFYVQIGVGGFIESKEVKLPRIGERVKYVSQRHKNNVFNEWKAREEFDQSYTKQTTKDIYTVVMHSGLMYALFSEGYV
jgi:hypothetical protein